MTSSTRAATEFDVAEIMGALYGSGITSLKGAFSRDWVAHVGEDIQAEFELALQRPRGAVGRGPNRHYVEIHPERVRGFVELATHPWIDAACRAVLGPRYQFVEVGFDVPGPGAMNQPWHRDFAAPPETTIGRRLSSLAFNLTTVDVFEDMGPFEIAPGTQWDDGSAFNHGMFPDKSFYPRYEERAEQKMPKMGDISVRTALTMHRGTANRSNKSRPVLVLGAEATDATKAIDHQLQMTRAYHDSLPGQLREHVSPELVDELVPIQQGHDIEGLVMGEA